MLCLTASWLHDVSILLVVLGTDAFRPGAHDRIIVLYCLLVFR